MRPGTRASERGSVLPPPCCRYTGALDFSACIDLYFYDEATGKVVVDSTINLTGFALVGGPATQDHPKAIAALKKLDLPVEVRESKLVLIDDWACASKGSPLTAAQAKMLFHLDMRVHEFKPSILASYVDGVVGD